MVSDFVMALCYMTCNLNNKANNEKMNQIPGT